MRPIPQESMPKSLGNLESYQARLQSHYFRSRGRLIKILHFKTVSFHFAVDNEYGDAATYALYYILAEMGSCVRGALFSHWTPLLRSSLS